jgi:hypothetical protein
MSEDRGLTERVLLTIESSDGSLPYAVPGLAARLGDAGTVFVPVPAVPPNARVMVSVPAVVVVALDGSAAGQAVGEWLSSYLDQYQAATLICAVGDRSVRLDAGQRGSAPEALRKLLET